LQAKFKSVAGLVYARCVFLATLLSTLKPSLWIEHCDVRTFYPLRCLSGDVGKRGATGSDDLLRPRLLGVALKPLRTIIDGSFGLFASLPDLSPRPQSNRKTSLGLERSAKSVSSSNWSLRYRARRIPVSISAANARIDENRSSSPNAFAAIAIAKTAR
jgi:hypothetical protein